MQKFEGGIFMTKAIKTATKIMSIFLSVLLIIESGQMSLVAFAEEKASKIPPDTPYISDPIQDKDETPAEILYEIEEKRDEYTKVYKKNDGTNTALISAYPLHYKENGKWIDIDNTLKRTNKNGQAVYTNTDNPVDIEFPEILGRGNGITVYNGSHSLSFGIDGAQESKIDISETAETSENNNAELNTKSETAIYKEILPDTNVEYSIISKNIKENIIILDEKAVRQSYVFNIDANGLSAFLNKNGSVSFFNERNEEIFIIPAPFMSDSANAVSTEITVTLEKGENTEYILTYLPSQDWLKSTQRQYPVTIDPLIALNSNDFLSTVSITDKYPDLNFIDDSFRIVSNGKLYDDDNEIGLEDISADVLVNINFEKIPLISENITPIDAHLLFEGIASNVAAFEAIGEWDAETVTYNTKPNCGETLIDYYKGKLDYENIECINFNITKLLWQWLNGEKVNNGIYIKEYNSAEPAIAILMNGAVLYLDYIENGGYDSRYDYHSQDVERAGMSYVNDFTRTLFLQRDDIGISGNIMPVKLSFFYNSALLSRMKDLLATQAVLYEDGNVKNIPEIYGNNWLSNYNRCLFVDLNNFREEISYATDTGSIINFHKEEHEDGTFTFNEENAEFIGESGYDLLYDDSIAENSNISPYIIIRPDGLREKFDKAGRIIKVYKEKYPEQSIDITYVSDLKNDYNFFAISEITDGAGRKYRFMYDETTGLLTKVQACTSDGKEILAGSSTSTKLKMQYAYDDSNNLTKVSFPDNAGVYYTYSGNRLTAASSRNVYKLEYTYDEMGRVCEILEKAQDISTLSGYLTGNHITIASDGPRKVTFSDDTGAVENKQFDAHGMTSLITDEKGNYISSDYGVWQTEGENLLTNHSFEDGFTGWEKYNVNSFDIVKKESYAGQKALRLKYDNESAYVTQSVPVTQGGTYILSAYIKSEEAVQTNQVMMLKIAALNADGECIAENSRFVAALKNDYNRYSLTISVPENTVQIDIGIYGAETESTFYIDCVQLERGGGEGAYNILENGSFQSVTNGNIDGFTSSLPYSIQEETVNTLKRNILTFAESKTNDYSLSKTLSVTGGAGDVLVLGGWIKADIVSNSPENTRLDELLEIPLGLTNDRYCGLTVSYDYTVVEDGVKTEKTETVRKPINDFIGDWQYVANCVTLKGECSEVTVSFENTGYPSSASLAGLCVLK